MITGATDILAVAYNIHETRCSILQLRPHFLLRLQNNHSVPFNNCEQEETSKINWLLYIGATWTE